MRFEILHNKFVELAKHTICLHGLSLFRHSQPKKHLFACINFNRFSQKEVVRPNQIKAGNIIETNRPLNRATRVISSWTRDEDFFDQHQQPKVLPLQGKKISQEKSMDLFIELDKWLADKKKNFMEN